ncbi:MAG TPA: condensation domain-containing protein, partial [Pyrinomonadaceae bacterium]|nr:condensation domain-containing protein [Pyrinomonadaceae bacterium]
MPGELCIGGVSLARGYLHRPDLTAERFVPDPFSAAPGARLYRTGDLARWRADGSIEYLGRIDQQIKLRGFRIELGEIEAVLAEHAAIAECVVVARGEAAENRQLVAYVVAAERTPAAGELRQHLAARLPEYMLPGTFVMLDALPLTPNGKVDRKALPTPARDGAAPGTAYSAPRTPVEEVLAGLWAGVLGVARVGVDENFFDLGGHSLLAAQLIARVRASFNVELPLRSIFEAPTIAGLGARIEQQLRAGQAAQAPPLVRVAHHGALPLSFAQQRLWFLHELAPESAVYHIPLAVRLTGQLDEAALRQALAEIVRRHEALRTTFTLVDGQPAQAVADAPAQFELPVRNLCALPAVERVRAAQQLINTEAQRPFDLAAGPLVRAALLRLADEEHVALLTVHHIIADGWSLGVLVRELTELYAAFVIEQPSPLAALPIQYADFAVWQREWLQGAVLDEQLAYWRAQLAGAPVLALPTDRPRPPVQTFNGARHQFRLAASLRARLEALSRQAGVTPFMSLLAGFQLLLARHSGQAEIVVGTPTAGRTRLETEGLIGFFVNTLALRVDVSSAATFTTLLARTREAVLGAHAHQDVPFERLVEALQPVRDLSRA